MYKEGTLFVLGYFYSDLAGSIHYQKIATNMTFYFNVYLIKWASQKYKVVALSTREAEFMTACQGTWI